MAREAVKGTDVLVAADIGPIPGENMIEKEHIEKEYVDIVNVFKECGVDIFVFETFPELGFIDKAIENAGENGFVITQFAINQFGYSSAGFSVRKPVRKVFIQEASTPTLSKETDLKDSAHRRPSMQSAGFRGSV